MCVLIDVAISEERNMIKQEVENILKCKDLTVEILRVHTWNTKTKIIPLITEASRTILESFRKRLSNISGKHNIKKLQNTGRCARIRKAIKFKTFNINESV